MFHPATKDKLSSPAQYRLLILDGHTSHATLEFIAFAESMNIIVICLPPHTTHALQPCDVGVFGPLASHYKKEVMKLALTNTAIKKDNLIETYSNARTHAFTQATIQSAWQKTGIYPFDPTALPESAYAPALATTSQSAQPLNAATVLPHSSTTSNNSLDTNGPSMPNAPCFLIQIPPPLPANASLAETREQLDQVRKELDRARIQIEADHAQKVLMDEENGELRRQLFEKSSQKDKSRALTTSAQLLTHNNFVEWAMAGGLAVYESRWSSALLLVYLPVYIIPDHVE